ncbi:zinc ABC transporter solute-binding protein [Halomonas sp. MCCC 1A11036]|uniref:Zinc ABC transporter solute-binding protein n=1 Tax=Billgrantia zhangzhouensis TaxID=2733481 RepID=A0ABS9AIV0_9GAMM|nr:zinc ABC transporter substrate-binding protein [Halomonas zhangzhouensis]MCE8021636.1 zinc ABC transporter solute-binding protein [Halomonas zhangzhouensis]
MPLPKGVKLLSVLALSLPFTTTHAEEAPLRVAATFSVLGDLVREVAGNAAEVAVLTPVGAEVHEWELVPSNFIALERAEVVFYNGYGLEQWIGQVEATVGDGVPLVALAEESGYATQPISTGELAGETDPHMWMDPRAAAEYVRVIADTLAGARPDDAEAFRQRAEALSQSLHDLHEELDVSLAELAEERRLLITSEAAFVYFADAFGFEHDGIWGTNAEEEGSPRQIMRIVDKIEERKPAAIFWESTISDRHVRSVANETEVQIAGPLYVDSLSEPDGEAPNYPAMLRHNVAQLIEALGGDHD